MYHLKFEEVNLDKRAKEKEATGAKSSLKQSEVVDTEHLVVQTTVMDMLLGRKKGREDRSDMLRSLIGPSPSSEVKDPLAFISGGLCVVEPGYREVSEVLSEQAAVVDQVSNCRASWANIFSLFVRLLTTRLP